MHRRRSHSARARVLIAKGGEGRGGLAVPRAAWLTLLMWSVVWMLPGVHAVLSHGGAGGHAAVAVCAEVGGVGHGVGLGVRDGVHREGLHRHEDAGEGDRREHGRERDEDKDRRGDDGDCSTCVLLACLISPAGPPREVIVAGLAVVGAAEMGASPCAGSVRLPAGLLVHGPPTRDAVS